MTLRPRIGALTGGGDAPGLKAVIRAVVKPGANIGAEIIGLEDTFDGLLVDIACLLERPTGKALGISFGDSGAPSL